MQLRVWLMLQLLWFDRPVTLWSVVLAIAALTGVIVAKGFPIIKGWIGFKKEVIETEKAKIELEQLHQSRTSRIQPASFADVQRFDPKVKKFKDIMAKTTDVSGPATDIAGKMVKEFKEALPTMHGLGFSISDLQIGMGLVPEIGAKLIASADKIDIKNVKELVETHSDNKILVGMLKALQAAYNIKQEMGDLQLEGVEVAVELRLPPHISVVFVRSVPTAK